MNQYKVVQRIAFTMVCENCLTSIRNAYKSLKKPSWDRDALYGDSPLYASRPRDCEICEKLWGLFLAGKESRYSSRQEVDSRTASRENSNELGQKLNDMKISCTTDCQESEYWRTEFDLTISSTKNHLDIRISLLDARIDEHLIFILYPALYTKEDKNSFIISSPKGDSASTMANRGQWSDWLQTCLASHSKCREDELSMRSFMPDRLIEIRTKDKGESFTWRVVVRADIENAPYVSLSHCWGSSMHTNLTRENYSTMSKFNVSSGLPKSFQHAFFVAFSLGFHFIWIDSLCIIQDDAEDWKVQASMMGSVYKNAVCNIAATWARNGDDGCFTNRTPSALLLELDPTTKFFAFSKFFIKEDLITAPLNTRGWVVQERCLAKRQLNFTKRQVYWECKELLASELCLEGVPKILPHMLPNKHDRVMPTWDPTTESRRRTCWSMLVEFYSQCDLTRISDKMIALAGLAGEMRKATGDTYLAGLWKEDLLKQLCWRAEFDERKKAYPCRIPSSCYVAPTWSWASIRGPVSSDAAYALEPQHFQQHCAEVLDASVQSEHPSGLHSYVTSRLELRGLAVWAQSRWRDDVPAHLSKNQKATTTLDLEFQSTTLTEILKHYRRDQRRPLVSWDENRPMSKANSVQDPELLCMVLPIFRIGSSYDTRGLILRRLAETENGVVYERIGMFDDGSSGFYQFLTGRLGIIHGYSTIGYYTSVRYVEVDINIDDPRLADLVHTVTVI